MPKGLITAMFLIACTSLSGKAAEEPELIKAHATAYCLPGKTYTGKEVREGICASGNPDLIGKTIIIYQRLPENRIGKGLGIYEVEDSGCNDYVIDVWCPTLEDCQEFMDSAYENGAQGRVYYQVIEGAEG